MKKELSFAAVLMMLTVCAVVIAEEEAADADTTSGVDLQRWFNSAGNQVAENSSDRVGTYKYCSDGTLYVRMDKLDQSLEPKGYSYRTGRLLPWHLQEYAGGVKTIQFENFTTIWGFDYSKTGSYSAFPAVETVLALTNGTSGIDNSQYTNSISTIQYQAFYNCSNLKTVAVNTETVENGKAVFKGNGNKTLIQGFARTGLEKVELNDVNVGNANGQTPFQDCMSLEELTIGNDVIAIGQGAFVGCPIKKVENSSSLFNVDGNILYNSSHSVVHAYIDNGTREVTIDDSVGTLYDGIFKNKAIDKITLGKGITCIPSSCFQNSTIIEVSCSSVVEIRVNAFRDCTKLTTFTSAELKKIGDSAFLGCGALKQLNSSVQGRINLKNVETDIRAFQSALDSGTTVDISGWTSVGNYVFYSSGVQCVIADSLTSIGYQSFNSSENLRQFDSNIDVFEKHNDEFVCNIPLVEELGEYSFNGTMIRTVFAYNIKSIGKGSFNSTAISTFNSDETFNIVFPSTLKTLGDYAFYSCAASSISFSGTNIDIGVNAIRIDRNTEVFFHDTKGIVAKSNSFIRSSSSNSYTVHSDSPDKIKDFFSSCTGTEYVDSPSTTIHIGITGTSSSYELLGSSKEMNVIDGGRIVVPYVYDSAYLSYTFGVGSSNPATDSKSQILTTGKSSGDSLTIHVPAGTQSGSDDGARSPIYLWNGYSSNDAPDWGLKLIESFKLEFNCNETFKFTDPNITWKYGDAITLPAFTGPGDNKRWKGNYTNHDVPLSTKITIGWWETGYHAIVDSQRINITWYSGVNFSSKETRTYDSNTTIGSFPSDVARIPGYTAEVEWYANPQLSGNPITDQYNVGYSDRSMYAKYINPISYTITIKVQAQDQKVELKGPFSFGVSSNGSITASDSTGKTQYISLQNVPKGYSFSHYGHDSGPTTDLIIENQKIVGGKDVTGDLTIYAQFDETVYQFTSYRVVNGTTEKIEQSEVTLKYTDISKGYEVVADSIQGQTLQTIRLGTDYSTSWSLTITSSDSKLAAEITSEDVSGYTELGIYFVYSSGYSLDVSYPGTSESDQRVAVLSESDGEITVSKPRSTSVKPGYSFAGWKIKDNTVYSGDGDFKTTQNGLIAEAKKAYGDNFTSVKLDAIWSPNENDIVFECDYGDGVKEIGIGKFTTAESESISVNDPSRVGYTFTGWCVYKDSTSTGADDSIVVEPGGTLTLTDEFMAHVGDASIRAVALWEENTYKVSFDGNGAVTSFPEITVKYSGEFTIPSSQGVTYSYYDFLNWTVDGAAGVLASDQVVKMKDYAALADNKDLKLTVKMVWNKINYTINFNTNGGVSTEDLVAKIVQYGGDLNLPSTGLTRTGYTFTGWSGTSGDDNIAYDNKNKMDAYIASLADSNDRVVLYAVWNPQSYKVSYSLGGGVFGTDAPETVYSGVEFEVGHPKRIGYKFTGWTASGSDLGDGAKYQIGQRFMAWNGESTTATVFKDLTFQNDKTVTMTANWEIADIKILYDLNGGSGTVSGGTTQGHVGMTGFQFPTISGGREGYKHAGWSIDKISVLSGFTDAVVSAADEDNIVTLYAVWTPQSYYIEFRSTEQDEYMRTEAFYDVSTELGTPERLGYTFKGWTSSDITSSQARYSMNEVVWLSWPDKSAANGSYVMNLSSQADKAVHLTATWEANSYRVVYSPNGGAGDAPKDSGTYKIGDAFELASTESLKGTYGNKILVGWATDAVATVPLALDTFVEGLVEKADRMNAVTLYAVWVEGSYTVSVDVGEAKPSAVPSGWELQDGKYVRSADYGTQTKDVLADWDSVVLEWDGHVFTGWKYDISSVITNISVTADYDEVKQWIIYAFVGIVAAVAIIAVVFTRLERW